MVVEVSGVDGVVGDLDLAEEGDSVGSVEDPSAEEAQEGGGNFMRDKPSHGDLRTVFLM